MTDDARNEAASEPSRRLLVAGLLGIPVLAACGADDSGSAGGSTGDGGGSGADEGKGGGSASGTLGRTSDVPVGGAKIYTAEKILVSQPSEGEFRAFSTVCTHRQCAITKMDGDAIQCGCHGSRFKVEDGSVAAGPATEPLAPRKVTVRGEDLVLG